jgi:hypothetical protein
MNSEERKAYMKEYRLKNKEKFLEYNKNHKIKNPQKQTEYNKRHWRKKYGEFEYKGKEHRKSYMRDYMKAYNQKYPHIQRSKRLLNDVLRRFNQTKTNSTSKLLGYTALDLKTHLDKLGMDWGLHQIDHKIPVAWFKSNTPMNIINDLRNLQPLLPKENLEKSSNYCTLVNQDYLKVAKPYLI